MATTHMWRWVCSSPVQTSPHTHAHNTKQQIITRPCAVLQQFSAQRIQLEDEPEGEVGQLVMQTTEKKREASRVFITPQPELLLSLSLFTFLQDLKCVQTESEYNFHLARNIQSQWKDTNRHVFGSFSCRVMQKTRLTSIAWVDSVRVLRGFAECCIVPGGA